MQIIVLCDLHSSGILPEELLISMNTCQVPEKDCTFTCRKSFNIKITLMFSLKDHFYLRIKDQFGHLKKQILI